MFSFLNFFSSPTATPEPQVKASRLLKRIKGEEKEYSCQTRGYKCFGFSILMLITSAIVGGTGTGLGFVFSKELTRYKELVGEIEDMTNPDNAGKPGYECYDTLVKRFHDIDFCKNYDMSYPPDEIFHHLPYECREYCETIRSDVFDKPGLGGLMFLTLGIAIVAIGGEICLAVFLSRCSNGQEELPFEISSELKEEILHFFKGNPQFVESGIMVRIGSNTNVEQIKEILKAIANPEEKLTHPLLASGLR